MSTYETFHQYADAEPAQRLAILIRELFKYARYSAGAVAALTQEHQGGELTPAISSVLPILEQSTASLIGVLDRAKALQPIASEQDIATFRFDTLVYLSAHQQACQLVSRLLQRDDALSGRARALVEDMLLQWKDARDMLDALTSARQV